MLLFDKYRPKTLEDFFKYKESQKEETENFIKFLIPEHNVILHGRNCGVLLPAILRNLYGADIISQTKIQKYAISGTEKEVSCVASSFHYEFAPSWLGALDTKVIREIVRDIIHHKPVSAFWGLGNIRLQKKEKEKEKEKAGIKNANITLIVIHDASNLSESAQHALKTTLTEASKNRYFRFLLLTSELNKVNNELQSCCDIIRVPEPSSSELKTIIEGICNSEGIVITPTQLQELSQERDFTKACCYLDLLKIGTKGPVKFNWELIVENIATEIKKSPSLRTFTKLRPDINGLLANCISCSKILELLTDFLIKDASPILRAKVIELSAHYEHLSLTVMHKVFVIEAFILAIAELFFK